MEVASITTWFDSATQYHREPPEPQWIRRRLRDEFFCEVYYVGFVGTDLNDEGLAGVSNVAGIETVPSLCLMRTKITDKGLTALERWVALRTLSLQNTAITDAGLESLTGLSELGYLDLTKTRVTDEGVKKLHQALPKCKIDH